MCIQSNVDPRQGNIHRSSIDQEEGALVAACTRRARGRGERTPTSCLAGSDGGSRDLWLPREVTQRLIYFTGGRPLRLLLILRVLRLFLEHPGRAEDILPSLFVARSGSIQGFSVAREGPAADIVPHTRPVSRLYTRLHRIYMRKESPSPPPLPPSTGSLRPREEPDEAPLEALSSVNTVHHYRRGSLYFKGHGASLFTLVPRHFGHGPAPSPPPFWYL